MATVKRNENKYTDKKVYVPPATGNVKKIFRDIVVGGGVDPGTKKKVSERKPDPGKKFKGEKIKVDDRTFHYSETSIGDEEVKIETPVQSMLVLAEEGTVKGFYEQNKILCYVLGAVGVFVLLKLFKK
jgi:hypothetical protein